MRGRSAARIGVLLLAGLGLCSGSAGCWTPPPPDTVFTCTAAAPQCPREQICKQSICVYSCSDDSACAKSQRCGADGYCEALIIDSPTDGGTTPLPDGGQGADLATPISNCRQLEAGNPRYLLCRGAFSAGGAVGLCPAGYALHTGAVSSGAQTACADSAIANAGEFFASGTSLYADPAMPLDTSSCIPQSGWVRGLSGCGADWGATSNKPGCSGFPTAVICTGSNAKSWSCPNGLAQAANGNKNHGVICSK